MTSSPTTPFWSIITPNGLKYVRVGLTSGLTGMGLVGLIFTNWHNDEYFWYIHNPSMLISWLAMACLTTLSFDSTIPVVKDFAAPLFELALAS